MDARGTAAARAVSLLVCQANDWAVSENVQLRRAVERARLAIQQGDRPLALRLLACALHEPAPAAPAALRARGHDCALCGVRRRTVVQMNSTGRWRDLPPQQRQLCMPCYRMQP